MWYEIRTEGDLDIEMDPRISLSIRSRDFAAQEIWEA